MNAIAEDLLVDTGGKILSVSADKIGQYGQRNICQICRSPLSRRRAEAGSTTIIHASCDSGCISYYEEVRCE